MSILCQRFYLCLTYNVKDKEELMILKEIPTPLTNHPELASFSIEPPNTTNLGVSQLLSIHLDTVEGNTEPLGYSTTASIMELEATSNVEAFTFKIDTSNKKNPELTLIEAIATKLLLEIMYKDVVNPRHYLEVAHFVASHVPIYRSVIDTGLKQGFSAAAAKILPHLSYLPNRPEIAVLRTNLSINGIRDIAKKSSYTLKDATQITTQALSSKNGIQREIVIFDVNKKTNNQLLYDLVGQANSMQIIPKLVGPSEYVSGIMTGQSTELTWNKAALSKLSAKALNEISGGDFDSLSAISERELRSTDQTPEHILIDAMSESGIMHPGVLIRAINQFLPRKDTRGGISKSSFDKVVKAIRKHSI